MRHAASVLVGGIGIALGVIFLIPFGGRFGLPNYPHTGQAIDLWQLQAVFLALLATIAVVVGKDDRALGGAVAFAGLVLFYRGAAMDPTHTVLFAFAALALWGCRHASERSRRIVPLVLVAFAAGEALYVLHQATGSDVFFGCAPGACGAFARAQTIGSLGTVGSAGAFLAFAIPLAPLGVLPLLVLALLLTHSRIALLAAACGLVVQYRRAKWTAAVVTPLVLVAFAWAQVARGAFSAGLSAGARVQVWAFGLSDVAASAPLTGLGLGGWAQKMYGFAPTKEIFGQAHNEAVQWIAEAGLIGLGLLVVWCADHRAMFTHPVWGGSVTALMVDALAWFPFHVVPLALSAIVILGLAQRPLSPSDPSPVGA